jgi:hypothetical protein
MLSGIVVTEDRKTELQSSSMQSYASILGRQNCFQLFQLFAMTFVSYVLDVQIEFQSFLCRRSLLLQFNFCEWQTVFHLLMENCELCFAVGTSSSCSVSCYCLVLLGFASKQQQ